MLAVTKIVGLGKPFSDQIDRKVVRHLAGANIFGLTMRYLNRAFGLILLACNIFETY